MPNYFKKIVIFTGVILCFTLSPINSVFAGSYTRDLMTNGGFESVPHGYNWTQYHNDIGSECVNDCLVNSTGGARSGNYFGRLGGTDNTLDVLFHPPGPSSFNGIVIPTNATSVKLNYYYRLTTNDITTNDIIDLQVVEVLALLSNKTYHSVTDNTSSWKLETIDLTPFKGKAIHFYFWLDNNGTGPTTFDVDDVSIIATYSDSSKPGGSIKINKNKKWTRYAKVTLYLNGTDSGAGVKYMRFSNNKKKWTKWIKYSKTFKKWDMSKRKYGGNSRRGTKKVYVQFKDGAGNVSKVKADTIRWRW